MAAINFTKEPFLAELRETEAVYTRAMKYLMADGGKQGKVGVSVCWQRLNRLHQVLPDHFGNPRALFPELQADQRSQKTASCLSTESDHGK